MKTPRRPRATAVDCPAKINLFLEVLRRRPDGYHEIATVMTAVSLADTLEVRAAPRDRFEVEPAAAAPAGPSNTVRKALAALRKKVRVPPVAIRLVKRIPSGAGLGGGSSDAAGLVRAVDRHFGLGLGPDLRRSVLAAVGSDTVFFDAGGTALCTGRGEIVGPPLAVPRLAFVLLVPSFGNPTPEVYRRLHLGLTHRPRSVNRFLNLLASGDAPGTGRGLFNRLERPAFEWRPELRRMRKTLAALPFAAVRMSGSGSALFGLCPDRAALGELEERARRTGLGRTVAVTGLGPAR